MPKQKKIALRSNIAGRIQKIREGAVYQDKFCFISELIQNSQRAKAKTIDIQTRYSDGSIEIIFQDDGKGCGDPAKVFTLDLSGWSDSVYQPFGEGFSSLYQVADEIVVQSKNWTARLNIKQALEEENFEEVIDIAKNEGIKGFKVTAILTLDSLLDLEEEIRATGSRVPVEVFLNHLKIEKEKVVLKPFSMERNIRGIGRVVLAPSNNQPEVELYYEGRFVTNQYAHGLTGKVFLKAGALTLKAPDRRAIVDDQKNYYFEKVVLQRLKKEVYKTLLRDHTEKIQEFSYEIGRILEPKDFMKHIFLGLERKNLAGKSQKLSKEISIAAATLNVVENEEVTTPVVSNGTVTVPARAVETDEIKEIKKLVKKGRIFYYRDYESDVSEQAALLRYYGATVLMADELQEKVLRYLNVPAIQESRKYISKSMIYNRVGAINKKEERILSFLAPIIKHFDLPGDIFKFADITSEIVFKNKEGHVIGKKKSSVLGLVIEENYAAVILLSRKELGLRRYPIPYGAKSLTAKDMKLLIRIIPVIAHELAHLIYNEVDNTLEIYKRQETLENKI
ncbi:hypothetical protein LR013_00360, partial [candidate division NPL-UPA2 bacterium]|nr:hypothetical protein [candidate division NPL-UPA2 bacterium]